MDNWDVAAALIYLIITGSSVVRIINRRPEVSAAVAIIYAMGFALVLAKLLTN